MNGYAWKPECKGSDTKHAERCRVQAEAYELLAKYYTLPAKYQRVFVAAFNALQESD